MVPITRLNDAVATVCTTTNEMGIGAYASIKVHLSEFTRMFQKCLTTS